MLTSMLSPDVNDALKNRWEPIYRSRLHYLVTWATRGRRPVLRERHVEMLEERLRAICGDRALDLSEVAVAADHVHVLVALKPTQSVASVVRELKGRTGMELLASFPELRVWLGGNLLWDERYAVETVSGPRVERVKMRLRSNHGDPEKGLAAAG